MEAFSDGVFAVAITLLVLDIHVPAYKDLPQNGGLLAALLAQWPMLLAYVTSFATILIMWMNHHRLFEQIGRKDHGLLLLNGLLLMTVTLVPFPTALLAEYIEHPGAKTAAAVYAGVNFLMALFFNLLWRHASVNGRLLAEDYDTHRVKRITVQYQYGPILYAVIFALAFVHVGLCIGLSLALAVFFALPERKAAFPNSEK